MIYIQNLVNHPKSAKDAEAGKLAVLRNKASESKSKLSSMITRYSEIGEKIAGEFAIVFIKRLAETEKLIDELNDKISKAEKFNEKQIKNQRKKIKFSLLQFPSSFNTTPVPREQTKENLELFLNSAMILINTEITEGDFHARVQSKIDEAMNFLKLNNLQKSSELAREIFRLIKENLSLAPHIDNGKVT